MRKRRTHASLILLALCIYQQWGRGGSVRNTISSSRDGKRTEHITIVANKLYIGDKEVFAGEMIETCINNEFRDVPCRLTESTEDTAIHTCSFHPPWLSKPAKGCRLL